MFLKQPSPPRTLTIALALGGILVASGCAPTVFQGNSSLKIVATPPPEPEPEPEEKRVEVTKDKIVIREKVQFEQGKSNILPESDSLLEEVAQVMNDNPRIKHVRIEGHASAEGNDRMNMKLSQARAKAVMEHLIKDGVEKGRLESKGFGETQPIGDNETESGRMLNRRVEFVITEQDDPPASDEAADESADESAPA